MTGGNCMKSIIITLALLVSFSQAHAIPVVCTNCSNSLMQQLERVTNLEQLKNIVSQYHEAIMQTQQQIQMVQQNIEQYANMIKNTAQLPANLVKELSGTFTKLASLTNTLKTIRGEAVALGEIYNNLFPDQASFGELALSGDLVSSNAQYRQYWDSWSAQVDQAAQATFQLSGQQLNDLQQDSAKLQQYIDELLSTPDGQQKAIMAGNQLSALQVQEARQLRELMATQAQSQLASQVKKEKEEQASKEASRHLMDMTVFENLKPTRVEF